MVGRTISHYRITGQLGAGGMGVVYSAEDIRLGRPVALKFVSQDLADDQQAVQRLRSEARAASALNHPHICTIYDIGEDNGRPFIVMELMKGQTLRERLANGPLKPHQVLDVGIEIADALHVAHSSGIIHRDIKPGNIFITDGGHVKILDFGLAKVTPLQMGSVTTGHSPDATAAGVMLGTTAYMSPEQVAGEQLDGRSDLFSLGVVLYELATGLLPFPGKTAAAVVAAILDRAPAPALTQNPEIPLRLQEAIEHCLEKDRELRYQSAADLRADLKRVRRDIESSHSLRSSAPVGDPASSRSSGSRSSRERGSHRQAAAALEPSAVFSGRPTLPTGALLVVAVIAVVAFIAYRYGSSPTPPPATTPESVVSTVAPDPMAERLRLAQTSLDARSYRAAAAQAAEILTIAPGHEGATKIRDRAQEMLSVFDTAIADANRRLRGGDFEGAARSLETARGIDPTAPNLLALSSELANATRRASASDARSDALSRPKAADRPTVPPLARNTLPRPQQPPAAPPIAVVPSGTTTPAAPPAAPPPPAAPVAKAPTPQPIPEPAKTEKEPVKTEKPVVERPTPPVQVNDDAAIRQLVANYARAIESKDLALFRSIKPNLSREEERRLQDGFRAVTSQRVNLTIVSIDRNGDTASVVLNRKDIVRAGGREYTTDSRQTLQLARTATGWGIVDIR
jgi:serine/threonine protein kinase